MQAKPYHDMVTQIKEIKKVRGITEEDIAQEMRTVRTQTVNMFLNQKISKPHRATLESFRVFIANNLKHISSVKNGAKIAKGSR